jgi:signal transduction histidine kinase
MITKQFLKGIIILLVAYGSSVSSALPNTKVNSVENDIERAIQLLNENPKKAIEFTLNALQTAQSINDTTQIIRSYSIICRANIVIGNIDTAKIYLDSGISTLPLNSTNVDILIAQVEYLTSIGKSNEIENLIVEAISKAKRFKADSILPKILLIQSDFYRNKRLIDKAINSANIAYEIAVSNGDSMQRGLIRRSIGTIQFQQSNFTAALDEYFLAKEIFSNIKDIPNLLVTLRNISLAYRNLGEYDKSQLVLIEALDLANRINNRAELGHIYNLLGSLFARAGKLNEAIENYNISLDIRKSEGFLSSFASTLENISRIQKDLNQFEKALANLELTIAIREELNDMQRLGSTYNEMGNLFAQQRNYADALKYYLNSLKIRQQANLYDDVARSLINIGITYRQIKSHQNALKYFNQALEIIDHKTDPIGKSYVYIHIGNTYRDLGLLPEAIENYNDALELRLKAGNKILISQALRSIAIANSEMGEHTKANRYLDQALEIANELNDERTIAELYNEKGNLSLKENKLQDALMHFDRASILFGKVFDLDMRGLCLRKIGEIQTKLGHYTVAYDNLKLALSLSYKTKNKKLEELTLLALYEFYHSRGQFNEALSYFKNYTELKDSLTAINQKENIWQASIDLELNKKAQEIQKIEGEVETLRAEAKLRIVELEQQKLIRNFLLITSLFVFIIAVGSVYGYLTIRKKNFRLNEAYEKLANSEQELKKSVQTKDKLFSIIAHDLRSPFTALVGLTEILTQQSSELKSNEVKEFGELIHGSSVKLLDLIENLLQWSRSQTGKINLTPSMINLSEMVEKFVSILSLQASAKEIEIINLVPKNIAVYADYNTLSTVIMNLISNALKFTSKGGKVKVGSIINNNEVEIIISDNGVGISADNQAKLFKLEESFTTKGTNQEAGTGLGLIVCKEFIEKNNGTIAVSSKLGEGTTFTIKLPSSAS